MGLWRKEVIQPALDRDLERAIAEQQAILLRDARNAGAHYALGALCQLKGDRDAAVRYFRKAIEFDSAYAAPHVSLGRIYAVEGDYDAAWRHAREAERLGDRSLAEQLARYPALGSNGSGR
ncbi:MAG TPA: tetratricopeptide repeat protein [Terriglobia bacterium]|jgi:Flp pilus assembly protein TadD|nr:tetratricopeptide repeat protein [Terriglobia bacterium]